MQHLTAETGRGSLRKTAVTKHVSKCTIESFPVEEKRNQVQLILNREVKSGPSKRVSQYLCKEKTKRSRKQTDLCIE